MKYKSLCPLCPLCEDEWLVVAGEWFHGGVAGLVDAVAAHHLADGGDDDAEVGGDKATAIAHRLLEVFQQCASAPGAAK